jgi:hypothetical protein
MPVSVHPGLHALRRLRDRHLVHLHPERHRGVVADENQHLGDALAAERLLDLGELGVRQFRFADQRRGEAVDEALVRVGELGVGAGQNGVDGAA